MNASDPSEFLRQQAIEARENRFLKAKSRMFTASMVLFGLFFVGMWVLAYFWEGISTSLSLAGIITIIASLITGCYLQDRHSNMNLHDYEE